MEVVVSGLICMYLLLIVTYIIARRSFKTKVNEHKISYAELLRTKEKCRAELVNITSSEHYEDFLKLESHGYIGILRIITMEVQGELTLAIRIGDIAIVGDTLHKLVRPRTRERYEVSESSMHISNLF